jgi:hypothetical protein
MKTQFLLVSSIVVMASFAVAEKEWRPEMNNLPTIVQAEGLVVDGAPSLASSIKYHYCLDREGVVNDILKTFNDDPHTRNDFYYLYNKDTVRATLEGYTRNQIIATEVVELARLRKKRHLLPHYSQYLQQLDTAKKNGDDVQYSTLLAVSPIALFDTFVDVAEIAPFGGLDNFFVSFEHKKCTPIVDAN